MTTSEFLREKNHILRSTIRIDFDLVPEKQIKDLPLHLVKPLNEDLSSSSCPYCSYYIDSDKYDYCEICPMSKAGNICKHPGSNDNTWHKYVQYCIDHKIYLHTDIESPAFPNMKVLIAKYNEELILN